MINGIFVTATFEERFAFEDGWLEKIYTSVQRNMAVVSVDMFTDEDALSISFHLGIDATLGTSEEFVEDVARDALDKAFRDAADGEQEAEEHPVLRSGAVAAFV